MYVKQIEEYKYGLKSLFDILECLGGDDVVGTTERVADDAHIVERHVLLLRAGDRVVVLQDACGVTTSKFSMVYLTGV
jgi:hypothetical protein